MQYQNNSKKPTATVPEVNGSSVSQAEAPRSRVSCALFLCVETLEAQVQSGPRARKPSSSASRSSAAPHFQHTTRRAAVAKGRQWSVEAENDHEDDDDEAESPGDFANRRVELARQRRAKYLENRSKARYNQEELRTRVEAQETQRSEEISAKISSKLEDAARRRALRQQERTAALERTEQLRSARLLQARNHRVSALVTYAVQAAPIMDVFKGCGLYLQGARTTSEIEQVLMADPLAPCPACCPEPGTAPEAVMCPVTHKRHSKNLVALSECLLSATGELRQLLHADRVRPCADEEAAQAGRYHQGTLSDESEGSTPVKLTRKSSRRSAPAADATQRAGQDPIGLPHFLPLAFHEACSFRAHPNETKLYAARNVILLLEEIRTACSCITAAFGHVLHEQQPPTTDSVEFDVNVVVGAAAACDMTRPLLLDLSSKCDHLRHTLSRFVKSWLQFSTVMRADQEAATQAQGSAARYKMGKQMIQSYIQLTATQHWRHEDVQRREELLNSSACPTPLKNREKWVSERRGELDTAIEMQMRDLRKAIDQAGLRAELEEKLAQLHYSTSAQSSSSSSSTAPTRNGEQYINRKTRSASSVSVSSASCGLSSSSNNNGAAKHQATPALPHVNSADWCGDLCSSDTEFATPEPLQKTPSPVPAEPKTPKKASSAKSSESFRAQLAADRKRLRAQRRVQSTIEQQLLSGNDGDEE